MRDLTNAFLIFPDIELGPSRYFQDVLQDSSIVVAGKLYAQSMFSFSSVAAFLLIILSAVIGAIIGGLLHTFYLSKKVSAKYRLLAGMVGSIAPGLVLLVVSDGGKGMDYWRWICPGYFTGAIAMV